MPPQITKELGPFSREPASIDECVDSIKTTFKHSLKTLHPFFMDKLYASSDPIGQISDLVVSVLNTNVHVYHVAPVFSVMEVECIKLFGKHFGFKEEDIDGTLNPGGSMSNIMALMAARHEHFPHVRKDGWQPEDQAVAFTAIQSHYSIERGAMITGMGMKNMIGVPGDRVTGAMDHIALEAMV